MNKKELELFRTEDTLRAACEMVEIARCEGRNVFDHNTFPSLTMRQHGYIIYHYADLNDRYSFMRDDDDESRSV